MEIVKGVGLLLVTLAMFSLFSFKAPKGQKAMSGLAGAAVATFLVEAIHKYISGDFAGIAFLGEVGIASGGMGGVAAAALVAIKMGANPVLAITAGAAVAGYGILPGFIAGYAVGLVSPVLERKVPEGLDIIVGAILIAPFARGLAFAFDPLVNTTLLSIGSMISTAAVQSPILMGIILGGLMKVICSSPLSAMALTAMLGLQGLAMGIAAVACVGGAFTDAIVFKRLQLGEEGSVLAVLFEPLTQAHIISENPLPVYGSNFFGGAVAGIVAAYFNIVNNAPGTAAPIPGLLAPLGFNDPMTVLIAMVLAVAGGISVGLISTTIILKSREKVDAPLQAQTSKMAEAQV